MIELSEVYLVKNSRFYIIFLIFMVMAASGIFFFRPSSATAIQAIKIFIDGKEVESDVEPIIINDRTMVPIRAISEGLGMIVNWDDVNRWVIISSPDIPVISQPGSLEIDSDITIMGESIASSEEMRAVLKKNNPDAPDLVDLYLEIGKEYGIRGDIAFCQAAKETGWWKFDGLVEENQYNYCGLGATGKPASGDEDLRGADPSRVCYKKGVHGAIFDCPQTGVEAHIQHLYAYACKKELPDGKTIVDPRFNLVNRGVASTWSDLNGKWAVPGNNYGESIISDYYKKVLLQGSKNTQFSQQENRIKELEIENQLLKMQIEKLNNEIEAKTMT